MTAGFNRWRLCLFALVATILLVSPTIAQTPVTLEIYTDDLFGIQSLRPVGWQEVADGTYSLNAAPNDFGILIAQSLPGDRASLLNLVQTQFGIDAYPAPETIQTDFLSWDVYSLDVASPQVGVYRMDMGLAELDGVAYLLMLQTSLTQYDNYHTNVFEPVVNGLAPLVNAVQAPPPYTVEGAFTEQDVVFGNPEMPLGATLTLPTEGCPCPAVVLVHDSGAQDRDGTILALRPYRDIAYGLAAQGIATMRYDKRTLLYPDMGESFNIDDEITNDALAAIETLRTVDAIDGDSIFVAGHGLGGMLAPRIAQQDGDMAGVILLAAPARNYEDVLADQANYLLSLGGGAAQASSDLELVEGIARIRAGEDPETVFVEPLAGYYESFTMLNQVETAQSLDIPVLVLQGERDYQTLLVDFEIWQSALVDNDNAQFISYPDLQHNFMALGLLDRLSVPADYESTGYVDEGVINDIASWIAAPEGAVQAQAADIELIDFSSDVYEIAGLVPAGWSEVSPGTFSRGEGVTDVTILVQQSAPGATVDDIASALLPSLQIDALPERVEQIETGTFTWDVYLVEVTAPGVTIRVDLAFSETEAATYLVLLQSNATEYDSLHEAVFLPALQALSLTTTDAVINPETEADATDVSVDAPGADNPETIYTDPLRLFTTVIPENWVAIYEADYGYLTDVDEGILLYLLAVEGTPDDMEQAIVDAWLTVNEDFDMDYTEEDVIEVTDGAQLSIGDIGLAIIYEDGSSGRLVTAGAEHKDGMLYMSLTDADLVTLQRRISQYQIIATSIELTDAEEETDLSGVTPATIDDTFIADLEDYIMTAMTELETPGATVAIVQGDEIIYTGGFGVKTLGQDDPVTADTLMMMGSTTKPMTTTLMAMLVDDGAMEWDSPVQTVLPEFAVKDDTLSETITIANLVCACTGVPRRDFELLFNANDLDAEGIVDSLATFEFFTDFGEAFQYSNQLVATGGYAAAAADGADYGNLGSGYADLLQSRFLDPLSMSNTTFDFETVTASDNYAIPHAVRLYRVYEPIPLDYEEAFAVPIAPAGGLWSTVADMAQFMILHLNNGMTADGTRLVSEENLLRTREAGVAIDADTNYGLGWFIEDYDGLEVISHGGNMLGFTSDFAFVPEADLGIVVLSNQQGSSLNTLVRLHFMERLYGLDPQVTLPTEAEVAERDADIAEAYSITQFTFTEDELPVATGDYTTDAIGDFSLTLTDEGELMLDSGEYQLLIVLRTDADTGEAEYLTATAPLPGVPVTFNDDGTFDIGLGVVAYEFTPVE